MNVGQMIVGQMIVVQMNVGLLNATHYKYNQPAICNDVHRLKNFELEPES
jgi:hypothetical protein